MAQWGEFQNDENPEENQEEKWKIKLLKMCCSPQLTARGGTITTVDKSYAEQLIRDKIALLVSTDGDLNGVLSHRMSNSDWFYDYSLNKLNIQFFPDMNSMKNSIAARRPLSIDEIPVKNNLKTKEVAVNLNFDELDFKHYREIFTFFRKLTAVPAPKLDETSKKWTILMLKNTAGLGGCHSKNSIINCSPVEAKKLVACGSALLISSGIPPEIFDCKKAIPNRGSYYGNLLKWHGDTGVLMIQSWHKPYFINRQTGFPCFFRNEDLAGGADAFDKFLLNVELQNGGGNVENQ